ncbi:MAG TPA: hypothetical protein VM901_07665 [Bdellovibrionota bacterium]|jgi:hypothetical protein|nr:hypothetical protein [Bdellovibrionota bacterium]
MTSLNRWVFGILILIGAGAPLGAWALELSATQRAELEHPKWLYRPQGYVPVSNADRSVYVFLSSECPCSDSYVDELNRLAQKFPTVAFVGVHANPVEASPAALAYFESKALRFPVIDDQAQTALTVFRAIKTPHAYVVRERDGKVLYHGGVGSERHASAEMKHYLEKALEEGDHPQPEQTKTMGCVIERKDSV